MAHRIGPVVPPNVQQPHVSPLQEKGVPDGGEVLGPVVHSLGDQHLAFWLGRGACVCPGPQVEVVAEAHELG